MFLFHLAEKLHMTVGTLLRTADSRELSEWQAVFYARNMAKMQDSLDKKSREGIERMNQNRG
jgi:hypothetical protein